MIRGAGLTAAILQTPRPRAPAVQCAAYRAVLVSASFSASLAHGEAVLRFPYDERLRQLLRAIPGRRWDAVERVWRIPLDPERAEALALLLASLPGEPHVSEALARAIERRRSRRRRRECVLDLARPDEDWWLSFATDAAPELVAALLEHPEAYSLPAIGRALIPLDDLAAQLVETLRAPARAHGARTARLLPDRRCSPCAHGAPRTRR